MLPKRVGDWESRITLKGGVDFPAVVSGGFGSLPKPCWSSAIVCQGPNGVSDNGPVWSDRKPAPLSLIVWMTLSRSEDRAN